MRMEQVSSWSLILLGKISNGRSHVPLSVTVISPVYSTTSHVKDKDVS